MASHLVMLAGGRGTRFWPLSRRRRPKQLLPLLDARSLLRQTWERVAPLGRAERGWIVTAADLATPCRRELSELPRQQVLAEPEGRNTAPAIALAALCAAAVDPRAVLGIFPSDHHIADPRSFRRLARRAFARAREAEVVVTLGIQPRRAETGYGYIETAPAATDRDTWPVRRFIEKPALRSARRFAASGKHFWNSGMFFASVGTLRALFARHAPEIWAALSPLAGRLGKPGFAAALKTAYAQVPAVSFDHAIMEKTKAVELIPADMGWSDVGDWTALGELLAAQDGNRGRGDFVALDASNNVIVNEEGLTALIGVDDLVVVRAGGALLVCHRERTQLLRELVGGLSERGLARYL